MITADTLDWYEFFPGAFVQLRNRAGAQGATEPEDVAQVALLRLVAAFRRGVKFVNEAALWAYVWRAYSSARIDAARAAPPLAVSVEPHHATIPAHEVDDLGPLPVLLAGLTTEQRIALLAAADGLPPRSVAALYPARFADVEAVYDALRGARERMQRALASTPGYTIARRAVRTPEQREAIAREAVALRASGLTLAQIGAKLRTTEGGAKMIIDRWKQRQRSISHAAD